MTDNANDFVGIIHFFYQIFDYIIPANFVWRPASRQDEGKEFVCIE